MKPAWLVKAAGTGVVAVLMVRPLLVEDGAGVIDTVRSFGVGMAVLTVGAFFTGVAFYCVSLQRCLSSIDPRLRAMKPAHVWLMYVPVFNIVEDFFIIDAVTRSLEAEGRINPRLSGVHSFGRFTGLGWCVAQVASLFPSTLGELASVVALALWLVHWRTVHVLTRRLNGSR